MPNYQNGKIYAIRSYQTDEIYIGSTTETLGRRLAKHRGSMKLWKEGGHSYTSSYKILEYQTCYIELLENCPCSSKEELLKKEGEYIRSMECVNKNIPTRTIKQYYLDNKEKINEQKKQYRIDNKDKIKEQKKQYYLDNSEKILEREKKYYEANKEQKKEYYLNNANKLKQKHTCQCGGRYTTSGKSYHLKTKKHQAFISFLPSPV